MLIRRTALQRNCNWISRTKADHGRYHRNNRYNYGYATVTVETNKLIMKNGYLWRIRDARLLANHHVTNLQL